MLSAMVWTVVPVVIAVALVIGVVYMASQLAGCMVSRARGKECHMG